MSKKRLTFDEFKNKKYGRLNVLKENGVNKYNQTVFECICECGRIINVTATLLKRGKVRSCGCYQKDQVVQRMTKHGFRDSLLYGVWCSMKHRCNNSNNEHYKYYGGRGIKVCREWEHNFPLFYEWALANGYMKGLTLDRREVNGDYNPNNCRWITSTEQQSNKRTNKYITFNGHTRTMQQWANMTGLHLTTISYRLKVGKSPAEILKSNKKQ